MNGDTVTDVTETIEVDAPEEPELEAPTVSYHTLLEVWRAILQPARNGGMKDEPVTPQVATKLVTTYPQLTYRDTPAVNAMLFHVVDEMGMLLDNVIASDDQCLKWDSAVDDVANNSHHYRQILAEWQIHLLRRELEWSPLDPDAAVMLAALSEVHNMFFGQTGLTQHLETIKFQFTDDDQAELQQALMDARTAFYGEATDE